MLKVLLISLLLTMIYSWEELKRVFKIFLFALFRKNPGYFIASQTDHFVGIAILLCSLPITLTYFLASDKPLAQNLLWLAAALLGLSVIAAGTGAALRYSRMVRQTPDGEKFIPISLSVASLFTPLAGVLFNFSSLPRPGLAKLAFWLAVPAIIGLVLKSLVNFTTTPDMLLPNIDSLIITLVGALILRLTIELMEQFFWRYHLNKLSAYFRIALGLILIFLLQAGV